MRERRYKQWQISILHINSESKISFLNSMKIHELSKKSQYININIFYLCYKLSNKLILYCVFLKKVKNKKYFRKREKERKKDVWHLSINMFNIYGSFLWYDTVYEIMDHLITRWAVTHLVCNLALFPDRFWNDWY